MDNASKIKQLLQQITGTEQSVFLFRPMEVVSVEGDTCRARLDELEIPGIRLAAIEGGADGGLLLKPATGSIVLVADLSCGELRDRLFRDRSADLPSRRYDRHNEREQCFGYGRSDAVEGYG